MQDTTTRRGFLVGGAAAIGLATTRTVAADEPPAASPVDHVDHITEVRDSVDELRNYAPKIYVPTAERRSAREDTAGQYGWIAESSEHDVTAYYFWTRNVTQRSALSYFGIDWGPDEHYTDHEPVICYANPDGTVDSVVYSGGHHLAAEIDGEYGHLTEERVSGRRTHVNLQQVRPWNHFLEAPTSVEGTFVEHYADFDSWLDRRDSWYRNGRYEKTAVEAIEDPFSFRGDNPRNHWWKEGTTDAWGVNHAWWAKNVWNRFVETEDDLRVED